MSFIIPKKPQIMYAPMLASFGGGSIRGFSAKSGASAVFDKYGELAFAPTAFTRLWLSGSVGTGSLSSYASRNVGALCHTIDPADFDTHGSVIGGDTADRPMIFRPVSGKTWSTMDNDSDLEKTQANLTTASNSGGSLTMGVSYYADDTSHYCFGSRVWYDQHHTNGTQATIRCFVPTSVDVSRSFTEANFSMDPSTQRFGTCLDAIDGFTATQAKDQAGGHLGNGQPTMHMFLANGHSSSSEFGFRESNGQNTHGNTGRGVFLGGKKFSDGTVDAYYQAQYNGYNGNDGYRTYKLDFDGNTTFGVTNSTHLSTYRNGDPYEVADSPLDYMYQMPSKWPYALTHYYNNQGSHLTNIHDLSASSGIETSTGIKPHNLAGGSSINQMQNLAVIHNNSGVLTVVYHEGGYYRTRTINTANNGMSTPTNVLASGAGYIAGIRPIPGTNRMLAVGENFAEYISIT